YLASHTLLRWRIKGHMHDVGDTTYWVWKKNSRRNLVLYADRPSKISGEINCIHLELRFYGSDSVRRNGVRSAKDLIEINHKELMEKHLKFTNFDIDEFYKKIIRETVATDRKRHLKKIKRVTNVFIDQFRRSIPQRVRGLLDRTTQGRIQ